MNRLLSYNQIHQDLYFIHIHRSSNIRNVESGISTCQTMLVIVQALDFDTAGTRRPTSLSDDFENNGHGNDNPEHNRGNTEQLDQEIMDTSAVNQTGKAPFNVMETSGLP